MAQMKKTTSGKMKYRHCPDCGGPLFHGEGCVACPVCGFSACV